MLSLCVAGSVFATINDKLTRTNGDYYYLNYEDKFIESWFEMDCIGDVKVIAWHCSDAAVLAKAKDLLRSKSFIHLPVYTDDYLYRNVLFIYTDNIQSVEWYDLKTSKIYYLGGNDFK